MCFTRNTYSLFTFEFQLLIKYAEAKDCLSLINESDNEGETPLHDAARNGNLDNMTVTVSYTLDAF